MDTDIHPPAGRDERAPYEDPVKEANAAQFDRGGYVSGYQRADVRHMVRIRECADLLAAHLSRQAPVTGSVPRLLDLGNGGGITASAMLDRGFEVVAGDIVTSGLRELDPRAHRLQFDAARPFPLAAGSCDAVLAGDIIHMIFDPVTFLRECRRVLTPNGIVVATTLNMATVQDRLRFLAGRPPYHIDPMNEVLRLHIRPFTFPTLEASLRAAGLRPVARRSNHVVLRWGERKTFVRWPARLLPGLGNALIVAAVPERPDNGDT
ncbi:class I SAM-dependent methyltransferase [Streptomyces sp. NPDC021098]|uniref:class I SAM-dependent methyltransferase n=1 Tax=unclassified Streptomyces TaxID=2593676 RepID=UPI003789FA29